MTRKTWFGFFFGLAVALGSGCADEVSSEAAELRGGRRPDPCATVRCAAGTHCESRGRRAECVPDEIEPDAGAPVLSCAAVLCIIGTVCEETPSGPRCVPIPDECATDSDCHLEDNYCGGCHCLALASGETAPTCSDPVLCFAAPCAVTSGVAACVDGQCVLSDAR